ncbi:MAG: hypothetical protein WD049_02485 [Candidatus Paceibacterota bacterium]
MMTDNIFDHDRLDVYGVSRLGCSFKSRDKTEAQANRLHADSDGNEDRFCFRNACDSAAPGLGCAGVRLGIRVSTRASLVVKKRLALNPESRV